MPEKVKSQIFEIVATENLCFDNTLTALGDVVFKMLGKLVLTTIIFKYGGYECRKRSKLKYFKKHYVILSYAPFVPEMIWNDVMNTLRYTNTS